MNNSLSNIERDLEPNRHADEVTPSRKPEQDGGAAPPAVVMRRVQQAYGNRTAQRVASVVQRQTSKDDPAKKAGGGAPADATYVAPRTIPFENLKPVMRHAPEQSADTSEIAAVPEGSSGQPLDAAARESMQKRFGRNLDDIRVHTDRSAADAASSMQAEAFTSGRDIYFAAGQYAPETREGQHLLAHELTHTVQQNGGLTPQIVAGRTSEGAAIGAVIDPLEREADRVADHVVQDGSSESLLHAGSASAPLRDSREVVQRYGTGEHAQLGETQTELQKAFAPSKYTVAPGDHLPVLARKFGLNTDDLKAANADKIKRWPAKDNSGRMIEGFNAGEIITIPAKLNELAAAAVKDTSALFVVNGVVLDYGIGIAMGDFFESPEQMAKASAEDLLELKNLISRERSGGNVSTGEWQTATHGRYLKLAEKNAAHFAPPNAARVAPTPAGGASANHKVEWEKLHMAALDAAKAGDKDRALAINAFGDHFLTDAFAAGHLINKTDVMELFKSHVTMNAKKELTAESTAFFDAVAADAFVGDVKDEFSKYETYETHLLVWHPNFDTVNMFSKLLRGIYQEKPDLLANAVAKGIHDVLNELPGGLPVTNAKGSPPWNLSGDGTLNASTTAVAREAVAQSQLNLISVFKMIGPIDYPALFKKVWDYTPEPDAAGLKRLVEIVNKGTDIKSKELKTAIVDLIKSNYLLMISELVKLKKLRKA